MSSPPQLYKLSRLKSQAEVIRQALSSCVAMEHEIQQGYQVIAEKVAQKPDESEARNKWHTQAEIRQLRQRVQSARDRIRKLTALKSEATEQLNERRQRLERSQRGLTNVCLRLDDSINNIIKENKLRWQSVLQRVRLRRMWMLNELAVIFPIENLGRYRTIRGFVIPVVETLNRRDLREEQEVSCGLGFLCHLLLMAAKYLHVPLKFTLVPGASKAALKETLSSVNGEPRETKIWPLYYRGDNNMFQTSVRLLVDHEIMLLHARGHKECSTTNLLENAELLLRKELHGV